MASVSTDRAKAILRFLVMNCLVSWVRTVCTKRSARRPGRGPLGCGAVIMMRALYSILAGPG